MTPGGCTAFGRLPFSDRQSPQRTWWKGEQPVFEHLIAAVAKFFFAAGLDADAFWAKYRSLMVPPKTTKTETPKPVTTPKPAPTLSAECMAKYEAVKAAKNGPADAFEALVRSFNESCRTTTDNKSTTTPKPVATPKPAPTVQLSAACVAKYEAAKAAKNGPADVFEALVRAFKDSCLVTTEVKS